MCFGSNEVFSGSHTGLMRQLRKTYVYLPTFIPLWWGYVRDNLSIYAYDACWILVLKILSKNYKQMENIWGSLEVSYELRTRKPYGPVRNGFCGLFVLLKFLLEMISHCLKYHNVLQVCRRWKCYQMLSSRSKLTTVVRWKSFCCLVISPYLLSLSSPIPSVHLTTAATKLPIPSANKPGFHSYRWREKSMYCTVHIIKLMVGWMTKVFYWNGLSN